MTRIDEQGSGELQFRTSESLKEFAAALTKAQAEIAPPKRDKTATFLTKKGDRVHYTYADLAAVIDAIRKPLTDVGIAIVQAPTSKDEFVVVTTRLLHISGEWIQCSMSALPGSQTPQAIGSVITYLRRYTLSAMTGVATEEDDDGAAAERKRKRREPRPAASKQSPDVEAAAAKLRAELLKRTTSKSAAVALLASITKSGDQPGIRNVAGFETTEAIDQAWARLEEFAEVSMMPQAKPESLVVTSAPEPDASPPEPDDPEVRDGSDKLFS